MQITQLREEGYNPRELKGKVTPEHVLSSPVYATLPELRRLVVSDAGAARYWIANRGEGISPRTYFIYSKERGNSCQYT